MIPKNVADTAAKWWRNAIDKPRFDNGDPSPAGGMTMVLAHLASKPIPTDQLDRFESELSRAIQACEPPTWYAQKDTYRVTLSVDYGPDQMLADAAERAGIGRSNNFPWKTCMWIGGGTIEVKHGYGAPVQSLTIE